MFKRFIKSAKDFAKKVWEFIKKLLPKKPKPKEEPEKEEEPVEPEETEPIEAEPAVEDDDGDEVTPYRLNGVDRWWSAVARPWYCS